MTMRILVVLIQPESAEAAGEHILAAAEGIHAITLLQFYDGQVGTRVCDKLSQDGWLGGRHSEAMAQSLTEDSQNRSKEACSILQKQLADSNLDVRCVTRTGDLVNTVLRVAETEEDVGLIIVIQPHHSWLTRWFKDFSLRLLDDRAPCEVRRIEVTVD